MIAKEIARLLNCNWSPILLGKFHAYIPDYFRLFGISTHLHGMYHFEFYRKIQKQLSNSFQVISGIVGDAWSGNVQVPEIKQPADVWQLGKCAGLHADMNFSKFSPEIDLEKEYFVNAEDRLKTEEGRIIELVRFKMMLLKYLMLVPQSIRLESWSPFLNIDISTAILRLDPRLRLNRKWQVDYFRQIGIFVDHSGLDYSVENSLDLDAHAQQPLPKLSPRILGKFFEEAYLQHCIQNVDNLYGYNNIVTLLPIQKLLWPPTF